MTNGIDVMHINMDNDRQVNEILVGFTNTMIANSAIAELNCRGVSEGMKGELDPESLPHVPPAGNKQMLMSDYTKSGTSHLTAADPWNPVLRKRRQAWKRG